MSLAWVDLTSEQTQFVAKPVCDERAWLADDIRPHDWLVDLDDAALGEITDIVKKIRQQPLPTLLRKPEDFEIPKLTQLILQAKDILDKGCGFTVIDALPMDDYSVDEMVACFWILGQLIGVPVAQKWDGTMIYDVTDTGKKYSYGVRGSSTNVELVFHTDNAFGIALPEYVGLLCKYPALEGGMSRFCSLYSVHNRMVEKYPLLLQRLYEPVLFDRQAEHEEGAAKVSFAPFFSWRNGKLVARANVSLVRKGYDVAGKSMDASLGQALDAVEEISNSEDLWYEAPIKRGQMQYLNNHELGHYRSTFTDHPDRELKRHLFRTWHRTSGKRTYDGL